MKINRIEQENRFLEIYHNSDLGPREFILYFTLLEINNGLSRGSDWADSFTQSMNQLIEKSKLSGRSQFMLAKKNLIKLGLVKFDSAGSRSGKAGRWSIIPLGNQS